MPIVRSILVLLSLARMALAVEQDHATKMAASQALFDQTVSTILKEHCLRCHGGEKTKSGLDLVTRESLMKGGDQGVAVVPGKPMESLLFLTAAHLEEEFMPPSSNKSNAVNLNPSELALLRLWIEQGGEGASSQDPDKTKVEAKRIKTTPSILKVKSLTFRKIGDSNTFIKFIGSAGSELNKVKIPDKRGLLSRMNLAGSGNSAMNMLLASVADPGGVAKTAGMSLGVGAAVTIPAIIGLRKLFKKKPNIKPNIKPNRIKGPRNPNTVSYTHLTLPTKA